MKLRLVLLAAMLGVAPVAGAQTAAEHLAMGDRDYAAMNVASSYKHYQEAIKLEPNNADALWRASRDAVDLGEFSVNDADRKALYNQGEQLARRAVAAAPQSSMAHFALARALGRAALSLGARDRVRYAGAVHDEALTALRLDSTNAGALHVMGMWNAEIMRLSGFTRFMAKNLLGGKVFSEASWDGAQRYLEHSVALEPNRIVHHLDLAGVYADRGDKARARQEYETVLRLPATEYNDKNYKAQAETRLRELGS